VRLLGYARRSTDEQPTTLDVQAEAVTGWAAAGGHELVEVAVETVSGATEPEDRAVLGRLLDRLAAGEADALVVTTTDRCARTQAVHRLDYYGGREGWALLILDALDRRDSPEEQLLHGIRVTVAEYERALIARRTRAALAYRRSIGVRIGRPRRCPDEVLARVLELRADGARLVDVAEAMNDAGVPTPGGGARWWPSHVSRLLATQDARTAAAAAPADVAAGTLPTSDERPKEAAAPSVAVADVDEGQDVDVPIPAAPAGRVVDLSAELGAPAGTWQLAETEPGSG
jgi:DNA invertase Pin-like site-specific DNA recombinase